MLALDTNNFASTSRFQIPTSSVRDDPMPKPHPRPAADAPQAPAPTLTLSTPLLRPEYEKYMVRRAVEVVPGVLDDGRLTIRHPYVVLLLANIPAVSPADGRKPPVEEWIKRGTRAATVNDILQAPKPLTAYQADAIFALAALSVLYRPRHPKHFSFWGRDPAPKTAARVEKVLDRKPCPIDSPVGWQGTAENLWALDGLQASLFPTKKEGKKVDNGMLLRKRKAHAAAVAATGEDAPEPPRKRTRTTRADKPEADQPDASTELPALPLPLPQLETPPMDKATKLELIEEADLTLPTPDSVAPPEPTRRSTRQKKQPSTPGTPASTLSPLSTAAEVDTPTPAPKAARPALTRARSSSSASGSSTAVSETGSAGDTAVEPDAIEGDTAKGKGEKGEKVQVRASGRVRKPAKKIAASVEEDAALPVLKTTEARRTRVRR